MLIISNGHAKSLQLANNPQIQVVTQKTVVFKTREIFGDILVGNPETADVIPIDNQNFYIQGLKTGATNITFLDSDLNLLGIVDVIVVPELDSLRNALAKALPGNPIDVSFINEGVMLTGYVHSRADIKKAVQIAENYSEAPVVEALRISGSEQVSLDVRILEVQRSAARDLGVGLRGSGISTGRDSGPNGEPFGSLVADLLEVAGTRIDILINALENKGAVRRLANPKLVAISGTEASFVVGGEVPITRVERADDGDLVNEVSYHEYGIKLKFVPNILKNGLVSIFVEPEVSDIDGSLFVNGNPSFITRKASTTVQLKSGQTFAIAGLLQNVSTNNVEQLPWLGDIPILGVLFRSASYQKRQSDLVIVITPTIITDGKIQGWESPLSNARTPDNFELFMLGLVEVDRNMADLVKERALFGGPMGHILELN